MRKKRREYQRARPFHLVFNPRLALTSAVRGQPALAYTLAVGALKKGRLSHNETRANLSVRSLSRLHLPLARSPGRRERPSPRHAPPGRWEVCIGEFACLPFGFASVHVDGRFAAPAGEPIDAARSSFRGFDLEITARTASQPVES